MELDLVAEHHKRIQKCQTCRGVGYRLDGRNKSVECDCLADALFDLRLSKSGIPPRFKNLAFKDYMYQNSPTFAKIRKYIEKATLAAETGSGLFLYGPPFTGKSMLACCIVKELIRKGHNCGFVTFSGLMSDSAEADKFIGKDMTFACIDNISDVLDRLVNFTETNLTHELSNGAIDRLADVLSSRIMRNQPTVLTSKASIKTMSTDRRFTSLSTLLVGNFLQVECPANDFRGERGQDKLLSEFGFDEIS